MKKLYFQFTSLTLLILLALAGNFGSAYAYDGLKVDTSKTKQVKPSSGGKITDTRKNKPASLNAKIKLDIVPFKPFTVKDAATSSSTAPSSAKSVKPDNDKILNNVKVYPNPVEDELNLSYQISKDSNVTIKVMDVLGNEITTLFSQKIAAGEQSNSFNIASKLKSGFYFIRLVAGQETIIKRISVL